MRVAGLMKLPRAACSSPERALPAPGPNARRRHAQIRPKRSGTRALNQRREGAPIPRLREGTPRAARSGAGPREAGRTHDVP